MIVQQRGSCTLSGEVVTEFIRTMRKLLSPRGSLQRACLLCRRQLPSRWMVILCTVCEHKFVGGGGGDILTSRGIEIIYFLHQLVQAIHSKRLRGDNSIPITEVDSHMERIVSSILAESETAMIGGFIAMMNRKHTQSWLGGPSLGPRLCSPLRGFIVVSPTRVLDPLLSR